MVNLNKLLVSLILLLQMMSCCRPDRHSGESLTETNRQLLIGDWYPEGERVNKKSSDTLEVVTLTRDYLDKFTLNSYLFMENNICENHLGFYEYGDPIDGYILSYPLKYSIRKRPSSYDWETEGPRWLDNIIRSYGNRSIYRLYNDSLFIYDPGFKKWFNRRIEFPSTDTLRLYSHTDSVCETYIRKTYRIEKQPLLEQLIFKYPATSYAYSSLFSIRRSGEYLRVSYDGKVYFGNLKREIFEQIENRFKIANHIFPLRSYNCSKDPRREEPGPGITFVMDGEMKTMDHVYHYVNLEDREFYQAFFSALFLPDYVHIDSFRNFPEHMPDDFRDKIRSHWEFIKNDSTTLALFSTESFYLKTLILDAKQSTTEFTPVYKMTGYDNKNSKFFIQAKTDGRYYRYLQDDDSITLDIGFNFIERYGLEERLSSEKVVARY